MPSYGTMFMTESVIASSTTTGQSPFCSQEVTGVIKTKTSSIATARQSTIKNDIDLTSIIHMNLIQHNLNLIHFKHMTQHPQHNNLIYLHHMTKHLNNMMHFDLNLIQYHCNKIYNEQNLNRLQLSEPRQFSSFWTSRNNQFHRSQPFWPISLL